MGKKRVVPHRRYTEEFKVEAVRLGESVGASEAARRLSIPEASLRNWIRQRRGGTLEPPSYPAPEKQTLAEIKAENARLRRELESARLDLEIVKKAAAYFAKESR